MAQEQYRDISSVLLDSRIINLVGEVDEAMAHRVTSALLVLDSLDKKKPIHLYINSPGGSIHDGLAIIDTMNLVGAPVYTYVLGYAASMGAAILSAGAKGHRYATPNSYVMIHQASSGARGHVEDMKVSMKHTENLNDLMADLIGRNCGKDAKWYKKATNRDKWLTSKDSLEVGIVDKVLGKEEGSKPSS